MPFANVWWQRAWCPRFWYLAAPVRYREQSCCLGTPGQSAVYAAPTAGHGALWNSVFRVRMPSTSRCVPHPKPFVSVLWGPGTRFLFSRTSQFMASLPKAESASNSPNPPDAPPLAAAAADNPGLKVGTGTNGFGLDPAVTPPTPSTHGIKLTELTELNAGNRDG